MKVAAVQFSPTMGDKPANLRRLAAIVLEAVRNDAQLIVLPELAATGYSFMGPTSAGLLAETITEFKPPGSDPTTSMDVVYTLASRYNVHIVWGLIEKDPGTGALYNTQVLMAPDGTYESYRKVNRWGNDFLWARPGRGNPPVMKCNFDGVTKKVGLLICRDVRDKKDAHWDSFYEKGDADIVCLSANWGDGGFPAVAWMDFVEENNVTLVVSNRYGKEIPNDFGEGGACVIQVPDKVFCDGLVWNQDSIVYADV